MNRTIAIVGRPNVGKSALFNRIVGRRIAIVHDQPGVTRDRIVAEAEHRNQRFEVIDTGGLGAIDGAAPSDEIAAAARAQAEIAIADAAVIVFVTDATAGITPLDREVADLLRKSGRPVVLAANKADNERLDAQTPEFDELGFPTFPVSALHNRGVDRLLNAVLERLPPGASPSAAEPLRVAIVGKPNAGKSSFINRVLQSDRVIVSPVPGTTRDSIEIPFTIGKGPQVRHYRLIDTAGLRRLRRAEDPIERWSILRAEQSIESADVVGLMIDAAQGPTEQDKKIAGKILDARKGCVVLVNKWDLAAGESKVSQREYEEALRRELYFLSFAPVVFVSSTTGYHVRRAIETIDAVAAHISTTIPTSTLNKILHDAVARVAPPRVGGKRLKFYYAVQTGTRPLRFCFFVNQPELSVPSYQAYLIGAMREALGLEGAPIVVVYRSSHER
ncbi:MAG: ribosome biogenesis GTPase Der [Kiritimatiellae bacterium]|nr:ribosome biogenesis GTPase Der [Kiritimatiellia bacterium]MDW8458173.1 ribosome biogenesis GTPase Der [Verrucomicrobiota bacterium]